MAKEKTIDAINIFFCPAECNYMIVVFPNF